MFKKPCQHLNAAALSVNEDFRNKIAKPRTFLALPFSAIEAVVDI